MGSHNETHALMLPGTREQETFDRLDALLEQVAARRSNPRETAQLVSEHVGQLVAGIEQVPRPAIRALLDPSTAGVVRWLELTLAAEFDRVLRQFNQADSKCTVCTRVWLQHLLDARETVARWAWQRETESAL